MTESRVEQTPGDAERWLAESEPEQYVLRLYVSGMTPRSTGAFANLKSICDEYLSGRYVLEVIDIYQHPELAREAQIIAVPTLIKVLPQPLRVFVGNIIDRERLLTGLNISHRN
jgi:circadian clock protein KaiB